MSKKPGWKRSLAAEITMASSKQTYYTIRFLVDREWSEDAYRAYGYFRWVDDILDAPGGPQMEKRAFIRRQRDILESSYRREMFENLSSEENFLVEMVCNDTGNHPGLRSYLHNMMAVMEFDVERRGRIISQTELDRYSHQLAVAVQDALFYFIGHDEPRPDHPARYHAVTAAHIIHMLRDTCEDIENGYYNIPREILHTHGITPQDRDNPAYRAWVCQRVSLAREYFQSGRKYIAGVKNTRCRMAGYAYAARFEQVVHAIEHDNFCLRQEYRQRKGIGAGLGMGLSTMVAMVTAPFLANHFEKSGKAPH